eukprot:CAMPEP_0170174742 /NCGR_PEP_ID=MMETSP0040_2-20121228/7949_1 /TAXON_ID=641309 /ORGANISM="Lotharella oceanica, Strain CCMP622" /LENGTH=191 /DNA_ID=CAMNT_0010416509 /DNA_START=154 /DNA_END=729 /DNA_ORIENTATION=+
MAGMQREVSWGMFDGSWALRRELDLQGKCPRWHVPPTGKAEDVKTFCVVRNPTERAVSEYLWEQATGIYHNGETNAKGLNKRIMDNLHENNTHADCHWVQQSEYVKHCDNILNFENLHEEFKALMNHYGRPDVQLEEKPTFGKVHGVNFAPNKALSVEDVTVGTLAAMKENWAADYRLWETLTQRKEFIPV